MDEICACVSTGMAAIRQDIDQNIHIHLVLDHENVNQDFCNFIENDNVDQEFVSETTSVSETNDSPCKCVSGICI